jgi:hypothetical protein
MVQSIRGQSVAPAAPTPQRASAVVRMAQAVLGVFAAGLGACRRHICPCHAIRGQGRATEWFNANQNPLPERLTSVLQEYEAVLQEEEPRYADGFIDQVSALLARTYTENYSASGEALSNFLSHVAANERLTRNFTGSARHSLLTHVVMRLLHGMGVAFDLGRLNPRNLQALEQCLACDEQASSGALRVVKQRALQIILPILVTTWATSFGTEPIDVTGALVRLLKLGQQLAGDATGAHLWIDREIILWELTQPRTHGRQNGFRRPQATLQLGRLSDLLRALQGEAGLTAECQNVASIIRDLQRLYDPSPASLKHAPSPVGQNNPVIQANLIQANR